MDHRLVLQYEEGQMTFRHFRPTASYEQLLTLAETINRFQTDEAKRVLLVTMRHF